MALNVPSRMIVRCLLLAMAGPAFGGGACGLMDALEAYSEGEMPDGAACSTFLAQGGQTGHSCHWAFSMRDPAATVFAAEAWTAVTQCRPGEQADPDQKVNHPDSFDLLEWVGETAIYRVSVKDKGALGQTLVFLGYEKR